MARNDIYTIENIRENSAIIAAYILVLFTFLPNYSHVLRVHSYKIQAAQLSRIPVTKFAKLFYVSFEVT